MSDAASVFLKSFDPMNNDDIEIPRLTISKIAKEIIPDYKLTNDGRELIANCCKEFIQLISSRASQLCNIQNKICLNNEHVSMALNDLGFGDLSVHLKDMVETSKKKRKRKERLSDLGIPEEELFRQQEELFAEARQQWHDNISKSSKSNLIVDNDSKIKTDH